MNTEINRFFNRIALRAESLSDERLLKTFVDMGSLADLLLRVDHQIVFGRRGTGKTHALKYLSEKLRERGDVALFVDFRTVGSNGGIYGDARLPLTERASRLLVDTLAWIHDQLLAHFIESEVDLDISGSLLDRLAEAITEVQVVGDIERETTGSSDMEGSIRSCISATIASYNPTISVSTGQLFRQRSTVQGTERTAGPLRINVHFGAVGQVFSQIAQRIKPKRLWLLLDEWSTVPLDLQPCLADLLRRSLFAVPNVTVKIAAIEQRTNFRYGGERGAYVGIEIGADASADINLDDFMVFDNDADRATKFFEELLFRNYQTDTEVDAGSKIQALDRFIQEAFTQENVVRELTRSAEGVPRDGINIIGLASRKAVNRPISIPDIRIAAKQWYERDKAPSLNPIAGASELLHWIIDKVIGERSARAFLLKNDVRHGLIDSLFDARILHLLKKGVSAHDQPGVRYDVYKLDYGCFVDLVSTSKAPRGLLPDDSDGWIEVPPDDYRAIRRAILNLDQFERAQAQ